MSYFIDRSLENFNTIIFKTDCGIEYSVNLSQTATNSSTWVINFALLKGVPNNKEVFKTMCTLYEILNEMTQKNNIRDIIVTIAGKDTEEINKKTKIFTRWIKYPWTFDVKYNPEITILGKRERVYTNTNVIRMTKM